MLILKLIRAMLSSRASLAMENLALRQQVAVLKRSVPRPRLRRTDRLFWVFLRWTWAGWRDALGLVQPATVVAWHRQGWRLFWRLKSRGKSGRPTVSAEVRDLIRRLSRENRLWGAPRIQRELEHLGHDVAKSTVDKYMVRYSGPPSPTWRAFLQNEGAAILVCDFFKVPTATFKTLTGFVVMELGRRRILVCDVTKHPTAAWAASCLERAAKAGHQFLIRDRDSIYGDDFRAAVRRVGLRQLVTAYKAPLQNVFVERLIGTVRRECLDQVIVLGEEHARRTLAEFATYYNAARCHSSLDGDVPVHREVEKTGSIIATAYLGGLHHGYERAA